MRWFNINRGEVAFIPEINLYFEMADLNDPRRQPTTKAERIILQEKHAIAVKLRRDAIRAGLKKKAIAAGLKKDAIAAGLKTDTIAQ